MAYDTELADRIRAAVSTVPLGSEGDVTEKAMFGGLAFLVQGTMAVAASGRGGLMVRVPPDDAEALLSLEHVSPMVMGERTMRGWVLVGDEGCDTDAQLAEWVERGLRHAHSLL